MKTVLTIVGILFLIVLLAGAAFIGFVVFEGKNLDQSSKAYVDESVPAVVSNWSKEELVKRESPQFAKTTSDEKLDEFFEKFRPLGPMKSYDGSKGDANIGIMPGPGMQITAKYVAHATFQNGKADIQVGLIRIHGEWMIYGFKIEGSN